ncbi:hypothetical protein X781_4000 [Mannheimia sp. USDA-ARS-USMARC-1261]|nr:hypothetical protein X781_4000 [Mannheimia sp. USDA-ARS-USMARC-1261]
MSQRNCKINHLWLAEDFCKRLFFAKILQIFRCFFTGKNNEVLSHFTPFKSKVIVAVVAN